MLIINSGQQYNPVIQKQSVFLAGPTYRNNEGRSWRKDAIDLFTKIGFDGVLYIPEPFVGDYKKQIDWENDSLNKATCIMFWIPRDLKILPGFTTNIEFGEWMKSGKVVLGYPKNAPKMDYLHYKAEKYGVPISYSLSDTINNVMKILNKQLDSEALIKNIVEEK